MNRLKLWLFALVVLVLSALGLRTMDLELRRLGTGAVDRQLAAAQTRAESAERALASELAAVAALAARDAKLAGALRPVVPAAEMVPPGKRKPVTPPPAVDPAQADAAVDQAAAEAVQAAQALLGVAQPGRVVVAASRDGLQRRAGLDADAVTYLRGALERKVPRGYAVLGGKVFAGAAVPLGEDGALAVFSPLDTGWAAAAAAGTGATLILTAPGQKPLASGRLSEVDFLAGAAGHGLGPTDAGTLGPVDISPPGLHILLPLVRSFLGPLPADRVVARPLAGVKGGQLVFAASTKPLLVPLVRAEWYAAGLLAVIVVLALLFGFLVKPTEVAAPVPQVLLEAARKIERGDFSARAPVLAGKVGTVADALNKAAEAAQGAATGPRSAASGPQGDEQGGADPFATASHALRTSEVASEAKVVNDTARLDGANLSAAAFEAAPVQAPRLPEPSPEPEAAPAPPPPPAPPAPAPVAAPAARVVPQGEPADDEQHWREVFRDFVRTRSECGESAEGLTFDRFRQKLETNRSALVTKYGCKTVRFQVYVKEGKAALKATPVR